MLTFGFTSTTIAMGINTGPGRLIERQKIDNQKIERRNDMSLASFGVVMVSANYRLGAFGFLYGGDPSAPRNVGIYDQILALKWVHNNIEAFGGDKSQITIFGESAGSWAVSALIVSPLSRNLFKRVIMQSGAYYFKNYRSYNSSYHLDISEKLSQSIGCNDDNKWLDCLRRADPKSLVKQNSFNSLVFGNELLPHTLKESLKLGNFQTGIEKILLTYFLSQKFICYSKIL